MESETKAVRWLLAAVCLSGLGALALFEAREAAGACGIAWDFQQPTCVVADSNRHFEYTVGTSWVSNQPTWLLATVYTPGNSQNIENPVVTPEWRYVGPPPPPPQYASGVAYCTCSGYLAPRASEGKFQLSAWDGTYWQCSGSFDTIIKPSGGSCD